MGGGGRNLRACPIGAALVHLWQSGRASGFSRMAYRVRDEAPWPYRNMAPNARLVGPAIIKRRRDGCGPAIWWLWARLARGQCAQRTNGLR